MAEEPTGGQTNDTIDALMAENRKFPPSEEFKANSLVTGTFLYDEAARGRRGLLGEAGRRAARLGRAVAHDARLADPERQVVRRRHVERRRTTASTAMCSPAAATRSPSTGKASPATPARSPTPSCSTRCQRFANVLKSLGRRQGRPGQHLPADDPRGGGGDARLRPHRRPAQRGVRRLLGAGARRPDQRRRGQGAHHRRRRLPPRRGVPAQARRRRGVRVDADDRARRRRAARRQRRRDGRRAATTGTTT